MFGVEGIPTLNAAATDAIAILREGGRTTMVVRKGDKDIGAIGLMDTPREAAKVALKRLRAMGITRMIMIAGDHQKVADAIAQDARLYEDRAGLSPDDEVASNKKRRR